MNNTDNNNLLENFPSYNKAKEIYLRINSYSNPNSMNDIDKQWIIEKIAIGLQEYANEELSSAISHAECIKGNYKVKESQDT